jgi:Uncharacterised nucleotidyltransferase
LSRTTRHGSFWPTKTQHALLEVALGPVELAATRWRELQPLDVTTIEPGSFGLLPLVYERLSEVAPDDPQVRRLLGTYRNIWYRNQLLLDRLSVLLPLLRQRAHVEPLLVGGISAVLRWYSRLGLRPVAQLDLIVEREAVAEAVKVAGYAGWRPSGSKVARPLTHLRDASGRVLVLHHGAPPALAGPLAEQGLRPLLERAQELEGVEGNPLVLDAADELLFACATGARTPLVRTCQWLVDVHNVLRSAEAPSADTLLERARRAHLVEPVRATVHYLADILPAEVMDHYAATFDAEPVSRRDRAAFLLGGLGGKRLGGTAQILATYLQVTGDDPPLRAAAGFPRHLQQRWGAESLAHVPGLALRKTARLFRSRVQAAPADRNRSASS